MSLFHIFRQISSRLRLGQAVFILLLALSSMTAAEAMQTEISPCAHQPEVLVQAPDPETFTEICEAATRALAFLEHFKLSPQREIYLHITEENIANGGYVAFGSYDSRSDQISLMSYSSIMSESPPPTMYQEPFDSIHYTGAIAHEIAHAVVQHNLKVKKLLSTSAQEYLAHATQLAVLPAARRLAIIKAMDVSAWESGDMISDAYMAMEPGKFAVKSYLHLMSLQDPTPFIDILLNSKWFYISVP